MKRYETGLQGEQLAEKALCQKGMVCLDRRYRGLNGEIDLVMDDGGVIVFVEVKYRPSQHAGAGLMAVTPGKQHRMINAALHYLTLRHLHDRSVRFDVVEITMDGLLHVPNAFQG